MIAGFEAISPLVPGNSSRIDGLIKARLGDWNGLEVTTGAGWHE